MGEVHYKKFISLSFLEREKEYKNIDMIYSPNSTTGGRLAKAWIIDEHGQRCLLKAANTFMMTEPVNEVIAYEVSLILGLNATKYVNQVIYDLNQSTLVSSCATFITPNTELIPASEVLTYEKDDTFSKVVNQYINFLIENNVVNVKEKIQKQLLLDALLDNTDRHLNNFGVIRNVDSLKIVDVAPNFDCGRILGSSFPYTPERYNREEFKINEFGYLVSQEEIFEFIDKDINLSKKQYQKLYELPQKYFELLKNNIEFIRLREDEINHIVEVFNENIHYVEKELEKRNCFI